MQLNTYLGQYKPDTVHSNTQKQESAFILQEDGTSATYLQGNGMWHVEYLL